MFLSLHASRAFAVSSNISKSSLGITLIVFLEGFSVLLDIDSIGHCALKISRAAFLDTLSTMVFSSTGRANIKGKIKKDNVFSIEDYGVMSI